MKKLRLTMALVFMIVLVFGLTKQTLADLAVGPSQIDFGGVDVASPAIGVVTVVNWGESPVQPDVEITGNGDFAMTSEVPSIIYPPEGMPNPV